MKKEQRIASPNLDVADLLADRFPGHTMQRMRTADGRYRYAYVSSGVQSSFGLDPELLMQADGVDHAWVHPDDRQRFVDELERSARDLTPLDTEVRVETPDGPYRWVRSLGQPRREPDGSVIWDGVALDVTDRREALEALERTLRQVRKDEASEGRFAHIAANDVQRRLSELRLAISALGQAGSGKATDFEVMHVKEQFRQFEQALEAARDLVQAGNSAEQSATARTGTPPGFEALTRRQREIMELVAGGASNREISAAFGISEGTVKLHISAILKRLEVQNRTEAAHKWNLVRAR